MDESTLNETKNNTADRNRNKSAQNNSPGNSSAENQPAEAAPAVRKRRLVAPTTEPAPRQAAGSPRKTGPKQRAGSQASPRAKEKAEPKGKTRTDAAEAGTASAKPPPPVPPPARKPKPQIGDSRPAPTSQPAEGEGATGRRRRRRGGRGRGGRSRSSEAPTPANEGRNGSRAPVEAILADQQPVELDDEQLSERRGKYRNGKPIGRHRMCVHVAEGATHIAVLEGRSLIEYYVSRPSDDASEIYGNLYLGRVRRVLPGMEAAFVDIGTPKQAVLYRGDLTVNTDDSDDDSSPERKRTGGRRGRVVEGPAIGELIRNGQTIMCQVIKNPIGHKGARLTTEVSLPGRFVVLIPNSNVTGISRRLPSRERRRLRSLLDKEIPEGFGVILRTAAESVTPAEIRRDIERLTRQWTQISELAERSGAPALLFREPELAVRIIREQFTADFREVVIDDPSLFEQVKGYMEAVAAPLVDRIRCYDPVAERLPLFERVHVAEQVRKATDRKVWLPSGGSLIIEHTEALTVIDVNTGRNVGRSSLNETLFQNNLEAATEIAKQLRLRDIGGIIVVDFVDMDDKRQREKLMSTLNEALARDKTRTATEPISDMGIVQMTRMRTGEGLLESMSDPCDVCEGRGIQLRESLFA
ncbi:Rne/Rng family ribonuclease [Candidatus Poriferisodalis sp.]|uniref:Rne/Rng family ribonuclease n=1 Tax=Candidatus Poriferisodalis sp. TaxID=3101277 RepID=UPI003B027241